MSDFDPSLTQRVLIKAKEEGAVAKKTWLAAHRGSLTMYYTYFVAVCIAFQANFPLVADMIPAKIKASLIGFVTFIVFVDKLMRSRPTDG